MNTFVVDRESVSIPDWVEDLDSFRRWARSDDFPDEGRICYLHGEVWVDMSKEQAFSHNQVKNAYAYTLTGLANRRVPGRYFPDGMLLTNEAAGLASRPDGMFVAEATLDAGLVRLIEGEDEGFVELEGSPDMVMEIISTSSVKKDKRTLPPLYWQANINEYWLVDARDQRLDFTSSATRRAVTCQTGNRAAGSSRVCLVARFGWCGMWTSADIRCMSSKRAKARAIGGPFSRTALAGAGVARRGTVRHTRRDVRATLRACG